jgi:hypothetical protein
MMVMVIHHGLARSKRLVALRLREGIIVIMMMLSAILVMMLREQKMFDAVLRVVGYAGQTGISRPSQQGEQLERNEQAEAEAMQHGLILGGSAF